MRGFVLLLPLFGGAQQTRSEAECPQDAMLSQELSDRTGGSGGGEGGSPGVEPVRAGRAEPGDSGAGSDAGGGGREGLAEGLDAGVREVAEGVGKPVEVVEVEGQQHGFFGLSEPVC